MVIKGPRTYTLVKAITDSGFYGIGEGYGSPGAGVRGSWLNQAEIELAVFSRQCSSGGSTSGR